MTHEDVIAVMARAIETEVAHPLASMRLLPETEEELAVAILNALDEAGFKVVKRGEEPTN